MWRIRPGAFDKFSCCRIAIYRARSVLTQKVNGLTTRKHKLIKSLLIETSGHLHRSIQKRFGGSIASTCPSPAHQVQLDLSFDAPSCFVMEPPGYQLHLWSPTLGLVSHTVVIGNFDGPYPFYEGDNLSD